jgi:hypothetical protein
MDIALDPAFDKIMLYLLWQVAIRAVIAQFFIEAFVLIFAFPSLAYNWFSHWYHLTAMLRYIDEY